jgi:hypothetical protein
MIQARIMIRIPALLAFVALLVAPLAKAQVLQLELADNFDRASLKSLESYAYMCAEAVAASYHKSQDGKESFVVKPQTLQQIIYSAAKSQPKVYGSAIAFQPGLVTLDSFADGVEGLKDGVRRDANGYGTGQTGSKSVLGEKFKDYVRVARDDEFINKTIYCPYAFNCTERNLTHGGCSSMDLAVAYDYSEAGATWFTVPRKLFEEELKKPPSMRSPSFPGIWTEPYFDAGAGSINMTTFSVGFGTFGAFGTFGDETNAGKFLGVCTVDVSVDSLCWTNCSQAVIECKVGQRAVRPDNADPYCVNCDAGFYSEGRQSSSCRACEPGFFSSAPGQPICGNCDDLGDVFQQESGQTSCRACPANTRRYTGLLDGQRLTGANKTACQCKPDFWRHDGLAGAQCFPCPEGGVCEGRIRLPYPKTDYWGLADKNGKHPLGSLMVFDPAGENSTVPETPAIFLACAAKHCTGGESFGCAEGYTGVQCSECTEGRLYWRGSCETSCNDVNGAKVVTVLGIMAVVGVWLLLNFNTK